MFAPLLFPKTPPKTYWKLRVQSWVCLVKALLLDFYWETFVPHYNDAFVPGFLPTRKIYLLQEDVLTCPIHCHIWPAVLVQVWISCGQRGIKLSKTMKWCTHVPFRFFPLTWQPRLNYLCLKWQIRMHLKQPRKFLGRAKISLPCEQKEKDKHTY